MSHHLSPEVIEQVRQTADIVEIVRDIVELHPRGTNLFGLCPFHNEKTASFSVNPEKQIFKCFGCGKAGHVFTFLMETKGISFIEAVEELAHRYGIVLHTEHDAFSQKRKKLFDLMDWATYFYQQQLKTPDGKIALDYVLGRGISLESIEQFRIGLAPPSWDALAKAAISADFSMSLLQEAGLCLKSKRTDKDCFDRFRNRIMFPIFNMDGKVIAFGGRTLGDEQPKYLNSPDTPLFSKSKILYGMNLARKSWIESRRLLIVEGYVDLIIAHQYGFSETIATLGTSLSDEHTNIIKRYAQDIVLIYDGDEAGVKASHRSIIPILKQGLMVHIVALPNKVDPSDFLVEHGTEAFRDRIDKAQDFWDFQMQLIANKYNLQDVSNQRFAIQELLNTVKEIPDAVTRQLVIVKIAQIFRISSDVLLKQLAIKKSLPNPTPTASVARQKFLEADEKFLIWVMLHYSQYLSQIISNYPSSDFRNPAMAKLAEVIIQEFQNGKPIDITNLSMLLEPTLAETLIQLYWVAPDFSGDLSQDIQLIEQRLNFFFKALYKSKHEAKLAELRQLFDSVHSDDQAMRLQILRDIQQQCKNYSQSQQTFKL